jgi:hypothetical protein
VSFADAALLSVITLNAIMLIVIKLSVIMPNAIILKVVILSAITFTPLIGQTKSTYYLASSGSSVID